LDRFFLFCRISKS